VFVDRRHAQREFMQVRSSNDHGAGAPQTAHYRCIAFRRHAFAEGA
jgi:hypothetical protein